MFSKKFVKILLSKFQLLTKKKKKKIPQKLHFWKEFPREMASLLSLMSKTYLKETLEIYKLL